MTKKTENGAVLLAFDQEKKIATLSLKMEGPTNLVNSAFGIGLNQAMDWALEQEDLRGIIITSGRRDFCAGAELDMVYTERDPAALMKRLNDLHRLFRRIETCGKPVVAAINGHALGGGYELALACHHRVVLDDSRILVGLPEVQLGLLPGAGGTQRLPRMIGLQSAMECILQSKQLRPQKALAMGLVDEVCADAEVMLERAWNWISENPKAKQPWDDGIAPPGPLPMSDEARNLTAGAAALLEKKTAGAYLAPKRVLSAMDEGLRLDFDRAMEVEARYFIELACGDQSKDMIRTLWFFKNAADKQKGMPQVDDDGFKKVGILGAGMMGAGIAFVTAQRGYQVVMKDISQEGLDRGMAQVEKTAKKKLRHLSEEERGEVLGRIKPTLEAADLKDSDLIIEAVFEDTDLKHNIIKEFEGLLAENGVWASNTSAIPITELAKVSKKPERFIGLHYFSPVEAMPLLEIVMGEKTNDDTLARCLRFTKATKKTPIVVNDGYGFFTSRVFATYILEGAALVEEGYDPVVIEWAARQAGMAVAPLQVFDEVTLSLITHAEKERERYLGKNDHNGLRLVEKMVHEKNRRGRASGAGFYDYNDEGKRRGLWKDLADLSSGKQEKSDVDFLAKRLLLVQCAEVGRAMDDGVMRNKRDVEVGSIFGIGFAPNTGGPLGYMDRMGLRNVVEELNGFAEKYGPRYQPSKTLNDMAEKGSRFFEEGVQDA